MKIDVKMDSTIMLKEEIVKASNNIRKKFNMIKNQNDDIDNLLETSFKPITTPLNALVQKNNFPVSFIQKENIESKKSTDKNKTDYDDDDTTEFDSINRDEAKNINLYDHLKEYLSDLVPESHNYIDMDLTYGIRLNNNNQFEMGNSVVHVAHNGDLKIKNENYVGSMGLYELIFKKIPKNYTEHDLTIYKKMLIETSAFRKGYDPLSHINGNRGYKYTKIISKLIGLKSGDGLTPNMMKLSSSRSEYVYWDNANELVERLRLLISSRSAGHNGHDNEILSIIEELREADLIL